ncbi:glutamate--cysteine ligase [Wolbachia endosymbiont of Dirofilaria (Dirofilaria) immitis]|uniref:glutamate--cysteine ligase n=1 Tax=Wolbachia endosymbiont of Dirofilaria (Dirofilaria) immitis TaxID=1812115 RepID=UPI00158E47C4|nr:glutamate--cysteine ligase [Wolbachia endosymbiont of Dirofilaria (Dirofilaria) immitis]QKX02244.1 glutamate--cysteine ligase [Wolbachia endosymbiont of Dirofilaria (Dirofilaria) immitis]
MQNIIHPNLEKNINDWFEAKFNDFTLPFYSSVDLRNSGYKIAPIDANLFPAGFNNLSDTSKMIAAKLIKNYFKKKRYKKTLVIPENYTRNKMYTENVFAIEKILQLAGFETKIGLLYNEAYNLIGPYETIVKDNSLLKTTSGFVPDVIVLNRDMTSHIPDVLENVKQETVPSPLYGWHSRQKLRYFEIYQKLASEFCSEFKIDPWLISVFTKSCKGVYFDDALSLKTIATKVDQVLSLVKKKYEEYKIKTQPYVFIKANNGTYGMGIITAISGEEILTLNKKKRHKMKKIKDGIEINSVIIQEGVPTIDVLEHNPAEPLIYYIGNTPTCYLYRCNSKKNIYSSLNSTNCEFHDVSQVLENKTLLLWNMVSKLAVLALSVEMRSFHI